MIFECVFELTAWLLQGHYYCMNKLISYAFALCLFVIVAPASGEDLKVNGKRYENIRWGTATPVEVVLFHKEGVARLPLAQMPPEIQQKFNYDPQKAQEYAEEQDKKKRDERSSEFYKVGEQQAGEKIVEDGPAPSFDAEIDSNRFYLVREINGMIYGPYVCAVGATMEVEGNVYEVVKVNDLLFTFASVKTKDTFGPFWLKDHANVMLETLMLKVMRPTTVAEMLEKRRDERTLIMEHQHTIMTTQDMPEIEGAASLQGGTVDHGLATRTNMSGTSLKKGRSSFK